MKTRIKPIILLVFLLNILVGSAQQKYNSVLEEINSLSNEASQLYKEGKYSDALPLQEKAIEVFETNSITDKVLLFRLYTNMSDIYGENRIADQSKIYALKAKKIAEKVAIPPLDMVNLYTSITYIESADENNHTKALGYITKAHQLLLDNKEELLKDKKTEFLTLRAVVLEWFVSLQMRLKNEVELLKAYRQFKVFYINNESNQEVKDYFALANFKMGRYYQNEKPEKAISYFDFVMKNGKKNRQLYAGICSGYAYMNQKKYHKVPAILKAIEGLKDLNRFQLLNVLELKGEYYVNIKDVEAIIEVCNEALTLLNDKGHTIDVLDFNADSFSSSRNYRYPGLLYQFSHYLEASNDARLQPTAYQLYKICLQQFDERLGRTSIESYRQLYSILKGKIYNHIIKDELLYEEQKVLISQIERIETQSDFNKMLLNRSLSQQKSSLDSLFTEEIEIRKEITSVTQAYKSNDSLVKQQLFELELALEKVNAKIEKANAYAYQISSNTFDLEDLKLNDNEAIFKFSKGLEDNLSETASSKNSDGVEHLYSIKISKNSITVKDLGTYYAIETTVISLLQALKNPDDFQKTTDYSKLLYEKLFKDATIPKKMIVVSDNMLRYVPFEVLKVKDTYLLEDSVISYASGLPYLNDSALVTTSHDETVSFFAPSYTTSVLTNEQLAVRGAAYDLEGAKEEVRILSELTGGKVYEEMQASKDSFLYLKDDVSVIHIAGHAFLNDTQPALSSFIFSDNEKDNKLSISELYGFKSNADLAVLSACNTGVGGYQSGSGMVSLSQAFLYAGIPATISSLWSAPDIATQQIMTSFYKHLKNGEKKDAALKKAKLDYLHQTEDPNLKHPYYWAGFVLTGNTSPIALKPSNGLWIYGIVVLVILFLVIKKRF